MTVFPAKIRVVGRREVPEDHIYPLDTPEQREAYFALLEVFSQRQAALCPVVRILRSGEPRVKRFRTLEEANEDQEEAMMQVMERMQEEARYDHPR